MKHLLLYPELPLPPTQTGDRLDQDVNCARCPLHTGTPAGQRCLPADGAVGDILVVGEYPTEVDRRMSRPFASSYGKKLRAIIERVAPGRKVVYANVLGCKPLGIPKEDLETPAEQCRPYLAKILEEVQPKLVILMGPLAGYGFLGRSYQPLSVRGGYGWCFDGAKPVPAFLMFRAYDVERNRLIAKAFESDFRKIINGEVSLNIEALSAKYAIVSSIEDAKAAYEDLKTAPVVSTDVETSGMMFEADFRIECIAISRGEMTYVYPRFLIEWREAAWWLSRALRELNHTSWNGQYDFCSIEVEKKLVIPMLGPEGGASVRPCPSPPHEDGLCTRNNFGKLNLQADARIKRKIITADAKADLETAAELVGMGGHKEENHAAIAEIEIELHKLALATELTPTGKARKPPVCKHVNPAAVPPIWLTYLKQGYSPKKFAHHFVDTAIEHRYVALDAASTWYLDRWTDERMVEWPDDGLVTIWEEVSKPAMWAWCRARMNGFPTDKAAVEMLSEYLTTESDNVLKQIHAYCPGLNPASTQQVGAYLTSLGLKSHRKTDSGASSWSKEVLQELAEKNPKLPVLNVLLRHRLLVDVNGDQVAGLLPDIRSDDRVHPSYLLDGTATGRPSSQDPNFFNRLKGRDEQSRELGSMLRSCHPVPPGWTMIEADEGQIEIRMAANLSRDPAMIEMLNSGIDFHLQSAQKFAAAQGKDPTKVTDLDREQAKTSNFAAIYEIPSELGFMLAMRLDLDRKVGEKLGDAMFKTYTGLRTWMERAYSAGWETGYSRTYWKGKPARVRPLWGMGFNPPTLAELEAAINSEKADRNRRANSTLNKTDARATYNGEDQGSSVDIITSMLWPTVRWLDANTSGGQFLLQIYDSIMLMVRDEDVPATLKFLIALMKDTGERRVGYLDGVPLSVDVKIGKDWAGLVKVKQENV